MMQTTTTQRADSDQTTMAANAPSRPGAIGGEFLAFKIGGEEYGIDILRVQEIRSYEPPTRIAGAPDFIKGVVNLRGVIVPIVDLRIKFNIGEAVYDDATVVIVLNLGTRIVGAVVDSVSDVLELGRQQIHEAPQFNGQVDASYITGVGSAEEDGQQRMLILVDIERLMSSPDMGLFPAN